MDLMLFSGALNQSARFPSNQVRLPSPFPIKGKDHPFISGPLVHHLHLLCLFFQKQRSVCIGSDFL